MLSVGGEHLASHHIFIEVRIMGPYVVGHNHRCLFGSLLVGSLTVRACELHG
jgi:hypothetical protein